MQNGLAGQEEEEQNEAMNAMVPTQAWDESGPPLNPPQMLNEGELPIGTGQESTEKEVCVTLSELLSASLVHFQLS